MEKLKSIHKILDELGDSTFDDVVGIQEMINDVIMSNIQVIIKFKSRIVPKIQGMTSAFNSMKLELDATKRELADKSLKPCSKCSGLENELLVLRKKQALNESRIKSIAKILSRQSSGTEISQIAIDDDEDCNQSSITKAYNLVSQVLGCGNDPDVDGPPKSKNDSVGKLASPSTIKNLTDEDTQNAASSDECVEPGNNLSTHTHDETDKNKENRSEFVSPVKTSKKKSPYRSPVLGKCKKTLSRTEIRSSPEVRILEIESDTCQDLDYDDVFCIPPSPENVKSSRKHAITPPTLPGPSVEKTSSNRSSEHKSNISTKDEGSKKKADFWRLKTSPCVDLNTSALKKKGSKLKQAKLSLGCFPKKMDISEMRDFNGGIRVSQTSTQLSHKKDAFKKPLEVKERKGKGSVTNLDMDDDIVMDSPDLNHSDHKRKRSNFKLSLPGKKLSYDSKSVSCDEKQQSSDCSLPSGRVANNKDNQNENDVLENSFDWVKKTSSSPKFKYRDGPVRKKQERKKLPGWDCDNCKKYYEALAGTDASDEEIKKLMDRCSKHRDKNPVRVGTPPGFWDADLPGTEEIGNLDMTHKDILPLTKKSRTKLNI